MKCSSGLLGAIGLTGIVVIALISSVFVVNVLGSTNGPTPRSVAAALHTQESAYGASLEVCFQQAPPSSDGSPGAANTITLIWAGDVMHMHRERIAVREEQGKVIEEQKVVEDTSYDRVKKEEKIHICADEKAYSEVGNWSSQCLSAQNPNPLYYPVDGVPLIDVIGSGSISSAMEKIDGHDCWRVEIDNSSTKGRKYIVWVDPAIGFNPRQIDIINASGTRLRTTTFSDYKEISEGVWFPYVHMDRAFAGDADLVTTNTITRVSAGKAYAREDLVVSFPKGTKVSVRGSDATYIEP